MISFFETAPQELHTHGMGTLLAPGMEESGLVGVREQAGQPQYWAGADGPRGAKKKSDSLHHYEIMINVGYKDVQNNPVQI